MSQADDTIEKALIRKLPKAGAAMPHKVALDAPTNVKIPEGFQYDANPLQERLKSFVEEQGSASEGNIGLVAKALYAVENELRELDKKADHIEIRTQEDMDKRSAIRTQIYEHKRHLSAQSHEIRELVEILQQISHDKAPLNADQIHKLEHAAALFADAQDSLAYVGSLPQHDTKYFTTGTVVAALTVAQAIQDQILPALTKHGLDSDLVEHNHDFTSRHAANILNRSGIDTVITPGAKERLAAQRLEVAKPSIEVEPSAPKIEAPAEQAPQIAQEAPRAGLFARLGLTGRGTSVAVTPKATGSRGHGE